MSEISSNATRADGTGTPGVVVPGPLRADVVVGPGEKRFGMRVVG